MHQAAIASIFSRILITLARFLKELRPKGPYSSSLFDLTSGQADDARRPARPFRLSATLLVRHRCFHAPSPSHPTPPSPAQPSHSAKPPLTSRTHAPKRADLSTHLPAQLTQLSLPLFQFKPFSPPAFLPAAAALPPFILSYPVVSYPIRPLPPFAHSPKQQTILAPRLRSTSR